MEVLMNIVCGALGGMLVLLASVLYNKLAQRRKPKEERELPVKNPTACTGITEPPIVGDPYAQGKRARAEYRAKTMWGPKGDEQGR